MRGRKPLPAALVELRGNPGKRPLAPGLEMPADVPDPPATLSADAREEWARLVLELGSVGVLARVDRAMLAAFCEAVATFDRANVEVQALGEIVLSRDKGPVPNPWLAVRNKAAEQILKLGAEFGFSPSSRRRVGPGQGRTVTVDPGAEFFN